MGAQTTGYPTVAQVAERLQLSEASVRPKIRDGTIPVIRLASGGRGAVRIPEHELEARLQSVRHPSNGPEAA